MIFMITSSFRSRLALIAASASLILAVSGCGNIAASTNEETSNSDASIINTPNIDNTGAEGSDTESPNVDSPTADAPGEEDTSTDDTGVEENSGDDTNSGEPNGGSPISGGTSNSSSSSCPKAPSSFDSKGSKGSDSGLSESGKYALSLIGYQEVKAEACAKEAGFSWRVIIRDGESFPGTKDYRFDRINAAIANGLVIFASVG
jgi:hypothetical protein